MSPSTRIHSLVVLTPVLASLLILPAHSARSGRPLPPSARTIDRYSESRVVRYASAEPVASQLERQVLALVSAERERRGLSSLVVDSALSQAARLHSQDMA